MPRLLKVSTANTAYQRVEVLTRNRVKRHRYGEFVIEGVRGIDGALAAGWTIRSFAYPAGRQLSRWATGILAGSTAESHLEMAPELFATLTDKEETPELLAVAAMRPDALDRIPARTGMLVVVADRPASPGNLGMLLRSCDAFGADGLIVTGHGVDPYDPRAIRASVGSFFAVPCVSLPSHAELLAWLDRVRTSFPGVTLVGTSAGGETPLAEADWGSETILVIGNETSGLSHAYRSSCDTIVRIPIRGTATSLNAAVAASIALYECVERRRLAGIP
jgi:TrmH family RNA methyltransferase